MSVSFSKISWGKRYLVGNQAGPAAGPAFAGPSAQCGSSRASLSCVTRLSIIGVLFLSLFSCQRNSSVDQVCFNPGGTRQKCFTVEIADKDETRRRGLQFREFLAADQGMLFIFPDSRPYSFWMKDTHIALDIIWLNESRNVVYIAANAQPCLQNECLSYTPTGSAMYVLELNAGEAAKLGLRRGDNLEFHLENYLRAQYN